MACCILKPLSHAFHCFRHLLHNVICRSLGALRHLRHYIPDSINRIADGRRCKFDLLLHLLHSGIPVAGIGVGYVRNDSFNILNYSLQRRRDVFHILRESGHRL